MKIVENDFIEEQNQFRFHRLKCFAENWIVKNLEHQCYFSDKTSNLKSIKRPQDYLDFLSLILLNDSKNMEEYFQIKDINFKIDKLISFLPSLENPQPVKVIPFILLKNSLETRQ